MYGLQRQFMRFLEENDLYDDFTFNLWKERKITFKQFVDNEEEPRFWADNAFIWSADEYDYWSVVRKKWLQELLEILRDKNR